MTGCHGALNAGRLHLAINTAYAHKDALVPPLRSLNLRADMNDLQRIVAVAFAMAAGLPSVAHGQQSGGTYYCVSEFSGGLAYDENLKKWDSARFRPSHKFVVYFHYIGQHRYEDGTLSASDDYCPTTSWPDGH